MIVTVLLTAFLYLVLQRIDENRREKNCLPPPSIGSRLGLLFFVAIVCYIVVFLFDSMGAEPVSGKTAYVEGGSYEDAMLRSIKEPVHVGLPPF